VIREGDIPIKEIKEKLNDPTIRKKKNRFDVLFVCSGNINRSVMAEGILKAMLARTRYKEIIHVRSAGTLFLPRTPAHEFTLKVCAENNIDVRKHLSQHLNQHLVEQADVIIALAMDHKYYIEKKYPDYADKVVLLKQWHHRKKIPLPSVADPMGYPLEAYREAFKEIRKEIKRIMPYLLREVKEFMEYHELTLE
jgi:protein-tyrosine-phosphatase